jgi:rhodanese-related sulfurtransferase
MSKTLMDFVGAAYEAVEHIECPMLDEMRKDGNELIIVDVREESEYAAGHIPDSLNIPRGIIETAADLNYPKRHPVLSAARDKRVVVYCATGGRSAMATHTLNQMGFTEAVNLTGGIAAWESDSFPMEN